MTTKPPTPRPCASCPYRKDAPSGVWAASEYEKLPRYDADAQPVPAMNLFLCHQTDRGDDSRLCGGWVATHGGADLLAVRIAAMQGTITPDTYEAVCDYTTDVPVFESGAAAAAHGIRDIDNPDSAATTAITKISSRRTDLIGD